MSSACTFVISILCLLGRHAAIPKVSSVDATPWCFLSSSCFGILWGVVTSLLLLLVVEAADVEGERRSEGPAGVDGSVVGRHVQIKS